MHIPEVLYYWRAHEKSTAMHVGVKSYAIEAGVRSLEKRLKRMGLQGEVTPIQPGIPNYRVRFAIQGTPKVSILIFDYDDPTALDACLESITRQSTWSAYEIVVVSRWEQKWQSRLPAETKKSRKKRRSNREKERETAVRPEEKWGSIRFLTWKENSNYPAMINTGMESCEGEYVVLLSQNTQILTPDWIQEMLMYAQRDDVGAVGAKIYDGNNMIRHAGYAYDYSGIPLRIFHSIARENMGYMGRLMVAQNLTAVSSDCMMFRRKLPGLVNGFDDSFTEEYYDVDFCIRVRQAGFLIVWTPFCELCQTESEETLQPEPEDVRNRRLSDRMHFLYRWINETEAGDPYFNPRILLTEDENHPLQVRKSYSK